MTHSIRPLALLFFLATLCVGTAGCSEGKKDDADGGDKKSSGRHGLTPEQAGQVLATIGETKITVGQFADELANQSPYLRARYNSPERRKEYLDGLVRFELLAQEAKRRGFFEDGDVKRAKKQAMIQQMMRHDFEEKFKLSDITEADIKAFYDANPDEFKKPEQARISHIFTKNKAVAQRILGQLQAKPDDDALFKRLAEENNEDPTSKDSFGDLGFQSRVADRRPGETSPVPDAVIDAAFKIEKQGGVASEVVEGNGGFHVVRLVAKRPPLVRTLEEARRTIQDRLRRERRDAAVEALVKELRAKASIKEDLSLVSQVKVAPAPEGATAPKAGGPGIGASLAPKPAVAKPQ